MIVLNENEWAEQMITSKSLGKKPTETLTRVARYYIDKGYPKKDVRNLLDTFMLQCDPNASLIKWSDLLDYTLNKATKYRAIEIPCINITMNEVAKLSSIKKKQASKLAFTLLCLSKFWTQVNSNSDYWVCNKDNEIMAMANINTSIKRQSELYRTLRELGLIQFSRKVDNTNVKVCFADEESDTVLTITDFRNLGNQYLMFIGEPYFKCPECGLVTKYKNPNKGRHQIYCNECAVTVNIKQRVNSVMKSRYPKF